MAADEGAGVQSGPEDGAGGTDMTRLLLVAAAAVGLVAVLARSVVPDVTRYLRIRRMGRGLPASWDRARGGVARRRCPPPQRGQGQHTDWGAMLGCRGARSHSMAHGQSKNCWSPRPTVPARREQDMSGWLTVVVVVAVLALIGLALSVRIVQQYEKGVLFRLGRVVGVREPGLRLILPLIEVLRRGAAWGGGQRLRVVCSTTPAQPQGIIPRHNVSVDVSAVAYYRVVDATKAVVAIENVAAAINQIAQTTLRKVVGQHTLDQTLAETDRINLAIREILDVQTEDWGWWSPWSSSRTSSCPRP